MSDGWYGPAIGDYAASDAGLHLGPVTVGVLHKTISPYGSYRKGTSTNYGNFGHASFPHFTTDVQAGEFRCWQHISLRKAAKALRNQAGGVETNREGVIQIEIVGYANDKSYLHTDPRLSDIHYDGLAKLMRWIESETDIPRSTGVKFHQYPPENGIRLGVEPWRLGQTAWRNYAGWLGHQHVPENSHGDPGLIDIVRLLALPNPVPVAAGGLKIMYGLVRSSDRPEVFAIAPGIWTHINGDQLTAMRKAKVALNDGVIQVLSPSELAALKTLVRP